MLPELHLTEHTLALQLLLERTECLVEFNTSGPVALTRKGPMVVGKLRCEDGDPSCDRDGQKDEWTTWTPQMRAANTPSSSGSHSHSALRLPGS